MRFLLSFLLLFYLPSPSTSCTANNLTNIYCCIHHTAKIDDLQILDPNNEQKYEPYRVIGLTRDCYVFYGWLHKAFSASSDDNPPPLNVTDKRCENMVIMHIKTQGLTRDMILLMEPSGHKVKVMNAMSGTTVQVNGSALVWLRIDPQNRMGIIYTGPVDPGFEITNFFTSNNRIFVLAKSDRVYRVYEMRVFIDKDNTQHAHLRKHFVDIDPLIYPPDQLYFIRMLYFPQPFVAFVPKYFDPYNPYLKEAIVLPLVSILSSTMRQVRISEEITHFVYTNKAGTVKIQGNKDCYKFAASLIMYPAPKDEAVMDSRWAGFTMSTRRTLNPRNAHRRMSAPHVLRRRNVVNLREGWRKQTIVLFLFAVGFGLILVSLKITTMLVHAALKKKKGSASTSKTH